MKPHKHASLIKAWADGAEIQEKIYNSVSEIYVWVDKALPRWIPEYEYRVKPREFENGARYPVIRKRCLKGIACYANGSFYIPGMSIARYKIDELTWIGDKLEIDWPKETN